MKFIPPAGIIRVAMPMIEGLSFLNPMGIVESENARPAAMVKGQGIANAMRCRLACPGLAHHEFDLIAKPLVDHECRAIETQQMIPSGFNGHTYHSVDKYN
ncbi:MAG: hypothetical protein HY017_15850 [Betaproteobacteria bacterium]|nr:hypothetical protein [Betaproteobacteria bacterium]